MIRAILTLLLAVLLADTAQACDRCGFRQCRIRNPVRVYQSPVYAAPIQYQAPAVAYPQQITNLSISNVYPTGSTVYGSGVASLSQLYAVNPAQQLEMLNRMIQGTHETAAKVTASIEANNAQVAEVAKLQLAVEHLKAATATGGAAGASSSVTLRITQGANGMKVETVEDQQPQSETRPQGAHPPSGQAERLPAPGSSIVAAKCASCHGLELPQPKAGLYFDAGHKLTPSLGIRALDILAGNDVPEEMKPLVSKLTNEEKGLLMEEILALSREE